MNARSRPWEPVLRRGTVRAAVGGALVAVALIATLSPLAAAAVRESVVEEEAEQVAAQMRHVLAASFTVDELRIGLTQSTRRRLDAIAAARRTVGTLHLRLWSRDGILLYSSDGRGVGGPAPLSPGLRQVLSYRPGASRGGVRLAEDVRPFSADTMYLSFEGYLRYLTFREHQVWLAAAVAEVSPEAVMDSVDPEGVARLYLPVHAGGAPARAAALEVAYDFRPLERRVAALQRGIWTGIPGGILALYGGVLLVMQQQAVGPRRRREALPAASAGFFRTLARVVDARDAGTGDHSGRVASYAEAIGRRLGLPRRALAELGMAAGLHDIGKISVPDAVLRKPGPLTAAEWQLMRRHAVVGSRILQGAPFSDAVKDGVRHVHEWWNGSGYPDGLRGERIPLFARILAVADAYEAMTSERPYREALTPEEALAELRRMRGVQFDPRIVDCFAARLREGSSGAH